MSAFGTVVIGKRETLRRSGVIGRGEAALDWPDQGTAERNWEVNSALLDRVIAAGGPIRDADAAAGTLGGHSGFLARERRQMRASGLAPVGDGYWRRKTRSSLADIAPALIARARAAATAGARTFALPEAAPVAVWIAAHVTDVVVRRQAVAWLGQGMGYHALLRLCARATLALDPGAVAPLFRAKVASELEPMLSLWPHALAVPTTARLSCAELIRLRAFPVHPLGLVAAPTWADGGSLPPSEYFFHDLDHARFKIREDLRLRGVSIPDAYRDGTTIDARTGRHRSILPFAAERLGAVAAGAVDAGRRWVRHLLDRVLALPGHHAQAAELLLFELVHEKSLPIDPTSLARACRDDGHLLKLGRKHAAGFFGADAAPPDVMAALPAARAALVEICS
jgi:hypothetical protein